MAVSYLNLRRPIHNNPELGVWRFAPNEFCKKYIRQELVESGWDLLIDEVKEKSDVWQFQFCTEEFCDLLINECEARGDWTAKRHDSYPTNDFLLETVDLDNMWEFLLQRFCYPIAAHIWGLEGECWFKEMKSENFIARYKPDKQGFLHNHIDSSNYSLTLSLSKIGKDYEGGGTWFPRQRILGRPDKGEMVLFPMPSHRHGGRATTEGKRYIIVSFCRKSGVIQ
jgi:hypothetical protein